MQCGDFRVSYAADERIFETRLPVVGVVALLVALAFVPLFAGTYWLDVLNRIGIAIIGAIGLNILVGFTGQISIGQAAFLAVGAYATAILGTKAGAPFWVALPLAGALTSLFGLVFGVPSLRLKGLYLAIATLAAYFITTYVIIHWESMTNGVLGFNVTPASVLGRPLDTDERVFYLIYALVVPAVLFAKNLFRTRVGRAFIAVRDRDVAASVIGVSLYRYKLLAFVISSFYAGVAGGLMAYHSRIVFPDAFTLLVSIDYLAMIIIGGMGSIIGSIYGAVFMTLLPEVLKLGATSLTGVYPNAFGMIASARDIVFGLAIIFFLMYEPAGLARIWGRFRSYWKLWPYAY
jgi:branched-chain amino acid transport system permease protein